MKISKDNIDEHSHKVHLGIYIDFNKAWRYQVVTIVHEHELGHHNHKHEHFSCREVS